MQMPVTAEDVVIGIFYHMAKNKTSELTADRERLHRIFYQVSKTHPRVMSLFSFRQRELFPESPQLDQALSNLDAAGLISRRHLTQRCYFFESTLDDSYSRFSKDILKNAGIDEAEIEEMAADIAKMVQRN